MTTGRALSTLEDRHKYLCELISARGENPSPWNLAEAAALEFAMDAIMERAVALRINRAARHAAMSYIPKESC